MKYLALIILLVACAKDPVPAPANSFKVSGENIEVSGVLNPGATISADQAKSSISTAVDLLEKK